MRLPWWGQFGALALITLSALAAASSWAGNLTGSSAYDTIVIYFYPNDYQPSQQYIDQIDPSMANVRDWYAAQLDGKTFTAQPVVVVQGQRKADYYNAGGVWTPVLTELRDRHYTDYCGFHTTLVFVAGSLNFVGGGGSCDAAYSGSDGGIAMLNETLFDQYGASFRGIIAHELGHAFTLPHPLGCGSGNDPAYCSQTVMWGWWTWPNIGLLDLAVAPEKQALAGSPFFSAASGSSSPTATATPVSSLTATPTATPAATATATPTPSGPDTVPPVVTIVKPANQSLVRGRWLRVSAAASDNVGVTDMQLYIDSQLVFTVPAANLDYAWDTLGVTRGTSISVTVRALDGAGNSSAAEVTVAR